MNKNTVSINEAITAGADPAKLGVTMVKVTKPSMMEETLWVRSNAVITLNLTNTVMVACVDGMRIPCVSISTTLPMQTHECKGRYRSVVQVETSIGEDTDPDSTFDAVQFYQRRAAYTRKAKEFIERTRNPKKPNRITLAGKRRLRQMRQDAHELQAFAKWCCGGYTLSAAVYVHDMLDKLHGKK